MTVTSCKENVEVENPINGNTVTDIDGNVYHTLTIGTQVWLVENLKVTHYRNGEDIETTTPITANLGEQTLPYQWDYSDGIYFEKKDSAYGRLYNWYAVSDVRNICPLGWHIPSASEWSILIDHLGGEFIAGGKMKLTDTIYWKSPNKEATNEIGFTAFPGGCRYASGEFRYMGQNGVFWTSTVDPNYSLAALTYKLQYDETWAFELGLYKGHAASVRCIKDQ